MNRLQQPHAGTHQVPEAIMFFESVALRQLQRWLEMDLERLETKWSEWATPAANRLESVFESRFN